MLCNRVMVSKEKKSGGTYFIKNKAKLKNKDLYFRMSKRIKNNELNKESLTL